MFSMMLWDVVEGYFRKTISGRETKGIRCFVNTGSLRVEMASQASQESPVCCCK